MSRRPHRRGLELPGENRKPWLRTLRRRVRSGWSVLFVGLFGLGWILWSRADYEDKVRQTQFEIGRVTQAVNAFRVETGKCPESIDELLRFRGSERRFLTEEPRDAWGTPLYLRCENNEEPLVVSAGPSRDFLVDDHVL